MIPQPDDRIERDRAEPDDEQERYAEMLHAGWWEDRAVPNLADCERE